MHVPVQMHVHWAPVQVLCIQVTVKVGFTTSKRIKHQHGLCFIEMWKPTLVRQQI